jgi:acid phosphatase family membrane protein YuiD
MEFLKIFTNKYLIIPIILWALIQLFKFFTDLVKNKKFNFKRLFGAGGMPSSHSAVVCSLAALIGKDVGYDSELFGLAVILACVVMYDAAGVRRAAGKQAAVLNKIINTPNLTNVQVQEKLVEVLGHTPIQVFVGAIIGIVVGTIF